MKINIDTKYSIGDRVYIIWNDIIIPAKIEKIQVEKRDNIKHFIVSYYLSQGYKTPYSEDFLFETKEDLVESLLKRR